MPVPRDDLSAEALRHLSSAELRSRFGDERDPAVLRGLAAALTASELDPSIRAYVATLGADRQQALAELLLAQRALLAADDLEAVYQAIAEAIEGYWCGFGGFTDAIARQLEGPPLEPLVLPLLRRAIFCTDLLLSLSGHGCDVPQSWVAEIRRRRAAEEFVEHSGDLGRAVARLDLALQGVPG